MLDDDLGEVLPQGGQEVVDICWHLVDVSAESMATGGVPFSNDAPAEPLEGMPPLGGFQNLDANVDGRSELATVVNI